MLVFLLTRRCNLKCTYCNVESGPDVKGPQLDLSQVEGWVEAVCSLGNARISVQLHGGEPLIVEPAVELYAAVIRNAVARHSQARVVTIGLQTNGLLLDDQRLHRLTRAGISVCVSMDGAASSHDRHRVTAGGKPSHYLAHEAVQRLQRHGIRDEVIAVLSEPHDLLPGVEFFIGQGLAGARMNPVRPEGRAVLLPSQKAAWQRDMSTAYLEMAQRIVVHNTQPGAKPFREDNLIGLAAAMSQDPESEETSSGWCLLVDESGSLWAHPSGFGKPEMKLSDAGDTQKGESLRRALSIHDAQTAAADLARSRKYRLKVCEGCVSPDFCRSFAGHATDAEAKADPLCTWRKQVVEGLQGLAAADPLFLQRLAGGAPAHEANAPSSSSPPAVSAEQRDSERPAKAEAIHPAVRRILDRIEERAGRYSVSNFVEIVTEFREACRARSMDPVVLRQLTRLSQQLRAAGAPDAANALGSLALIGIELKATSS